MRYFSNISSGATGAAPGGARDVLGLHLLDGLLDLDRLAAQDPDPLGVTLDQSATGHLVVVLKCLGDQVDGPREGEHHEDDC